MECPKCQSEIGNAGYCGCGWKQHASPNAFNPNASAAKCSFTGCYLPSLFADGPCDHHYLAEHQDRANANSAALGLTTPADHHAWLKARPGKGYKRFPRQPGQDDEERFT